MCSSRDICGGNSRPNRSSRSGSSSSGAHYALCALGVGLIALGIVMIVWTVIPMNKDAPGGSPTPSGNSTARPGSGNNNGQNTDTAKSSIVAMVLVSAGGAILLLSICLGLRSKRRTRSRRNQPVAAQAAFVDHVAQDQEES